MGPAILHFKKMNVVNPWYFQTIGINILCHSLKINRHYYVLGITLGGRDDAPISFLLLSFAVLKNKAERPL